MLFRILLLTTALLLGGCAPSSTPATNAPAHHTDGGFRNPPGSPVHNIGFWQTILAFTDRMGESFTGYAPVLSSEYILPPDEVRAGMARAQSADSLTWLGHATLLIRLGGKTILTDPFLTDFATARPPFGPKRATPPALTIKQLPWIDILVVSHNHYDHLDAPTIEALPRKKHIRVFVPLGLGAFFTSRGFTRVTELDWYKSTAIDDLKLTAVPAIHGSGRGLFDRDQTLWAGYMFQHGAKQLYFSGDTAYGPVFNHINKKFGPIDYALVPIGAYEPRARMKAVHTNPAEALQIGMDLQAKTIIPIHWGTIRLSEEAFEDAPRQFRKAALAAGISNRAQILKIGQSRFLD